MNEDAYTSYGEKKCDVCFRSKSEAKGNPLCTRCKEEEYLFYKRHPRHCSRYYGDNGITLLVKNPNILK